MPKNLSESMRDLEFFERASDYENHIWESVFTEDWVHNTPFYRNLVNFVLDHHAPIFYTVSDKAEHFAFSGAYYFETRRTRYPNKTREQLFWLHDFTHMLFPYAHDVYEVSEKDFLAQFWYQERIASSETEIMAYHRVPSLREKVFPDEKLWYDVLRERGWSTPYTGVGWTIADDNPARRRFAANAKPDVSIFLDYRVRVQMEDEFGQTELGDHLEILKFVQSWRRLTPKWISKRYASMAGRRIEAPQRDKNFTVQNYERRIMEYDQSARPHTFVRQENYERHIMENVRMAYDLAELPGKPEKWRHMPEAIDRLEGAVLLT
jgi:hypothetical protein